MLEYSTGDGDHAVNIPERDAAVGRPDDWVPAAGVVALGAAVPAPEPLSLTYTVTVEDAMASVLEHPAARKRIEAQLWKAGWRRGLPRMALTLGLMLLADLFLFDLGLAWTFLSTLLLGGLVALVQWSQIDHGIKRRLPDVLAKQALHDLAQRGDQRRIVAEPGGLTLSDAAATGHYAWQQVQLTETDRYLILTALGARWAIPQRLGQPLASFVQFARSHGAS